MLIFVYTSWMEVMKVGFCQENPFFSKDAARSFQTQTRCVEVNISRRAGTPAPILICALLGRAAPYSSSPFVPYLFHHTRLSFGLTHITVIVSKVKDVVPKWRHWVWACLWHTYIYRLHWICGTLCSAAVEKRLIQIWVEPHPVTNEIHSNTQGRGNRIISTLQSLVEKRTLS